jgi:hypothetical protein
LTRKLHAVVTGAIVVVAIANFVAVWVTQAVFGRGDMSYEYAGHFFLWYGGHFREVSETVWQFSRFVTQTMLLTWPLMFLAGLSFVLAEARRALAGRLGSSASKERAALARSLGRPIASRRVAGSIGRVDFSGPLLKVTVYPEALVVKPWLLPAHSILASEIRDVRTGRRSRHDYIEVNHDGEDMPSPVALWESGEAPLGAAIRTIAQDGDGWRKPIQPTRPPAWRYWIPGVLIRSASRTGHSGSSDGVTRSGTTS